jgi:hypothetical protein
VVPTWQYFDDELDRRPVAASFESVMKAFKAAVCGELEVKDVRFRCPKPQSGAAGGAV